MKKILVNQKIYLRNLPEGSIERQRDGKNEGEVKTHGGMNKKVPRTTNRSFRGETR